MDEFKWGDSSMFMNEDEIKSVDELTRKFGLQEWLVLMWSEGNTPVVAMHLQDEYSVEMLRELLYNLLVSITSSQGIIQRDQQFRHCGHA